MLGQGVESSSEPCPFDDGWHASHNAGDAIIADENRFVFQRKTVAGMSLAAERAIVRVLDDGLDVIYVHENVNEVAGSTNGFLRGHEHFDGGLRWIASADRAAV